MQESQRRNRAPSTLHFFNSLIELTRVSEAVLLSTYRDTPWCLPTGKGDSTHQDTHSSPIQLYVQMQLVMSQEEKLASWLAGLPDHLDFNYCNSNPRLRKQQRTLQVRYLHARLTIHRQSVISAIRRDKDREREHGDSFLNTVLIAGVRQCVESACDLANLVKQHSKEDSLGPWWLNVQCEICSRPD